MAAAAAPLGLQRVIWNRREYSADVPNGETYRGPHPHDDHLHIEQAPDAALSLSPREAEAVVGGWWEDDRVTLGLLAQRGGGVYLLRPDLTGKVALRSSADHRALLATGLYTTVDLSDAQIDAVPAVQSS